MKRRLFVIIPSLESTGPIKGAIALCNGISEYVRVSIVVLKPCKVIDLNISKDVEVIELFNKGGWAKRLSFFDKAILDELKITNSMPICLSMCFSADLFNYISRSKATRWSSIRGNLPENYGTTYGLIGEIIGRLQYRMISKFDGVIAMTISMGNQYYRLTGKRAFVIGNFIDEETIEMYRQKTNTVSKTLGFVFVGRLAKNKDPVSVIKSIHKLVNEGHECSLDILGEGEEEEKLISLVETFGLSGMVTFHGHLKNPWQIAANAHCLVLPSLTEGISRASLEALCLGVPCVMRNVDGNGELITEGKNGELFSDLSELPEKMVAAAELGRRYANQRPNLLPRNFTKSIGIQKYHNLFSLSDGSN